MVTTPAGVEIRTPGVTRAAGTSPRCLRSAFSAVGCRCGRRGACLGEVAAGHGAAGESSALGALLGQAGTDQGRAGGWGEPRPGCRGDDREVLGLAELHGVLVGGGPGPGCPGPGEGGQCLARWTIRARIRTRSGQVSGYRGGCSWGRPPTATGQGSAFQLAWASWRMTTAWPSVVNSARTARGPVCHVGRPVAVGGVGKLPRDLLRPGEAARGGSRARGTGGRSTGSCWTSPDGR